ncbi:hypothetical protein ID866_8387 [Astraeus odoratus]|nr:hypothetical protein ID866_8387 [Astraeus odoratus]
MGISQIVRSKAERQRHFKKTGVDPEYIYYWDVAKGTVDLHPIGQVYGIRNLYQDYKNTGNVNVVEQKLAVLERKAAAIIADLHTVLPTHKFSIKRRPLEDLRKFLFLMHFRSTLCSSVYFDENHPENAPAKLWIESYKKSHGCDSSTEVWVHMLQYYLDNSHSWLMSRAAEIADKYGDDFYGLGFERAIPPDLEHYPADPPLATYHNGARTLHVSDGLAAMENYRASKQAEEDTFTFEIKKLSAIETMEVNSILLENVRKDGSVTFASATCMLRTAHTYCSRLFRVMKNPRIIGLLKLLKEDMMAAPETDPTKLVHFKLFTLLLDLSTGNKTFVSAYDRARAVLDLLSDDVHCSSVFVSELGERSRAIHMQFLRDCNQRDLPTMKFCVNTLPDTTSISLFSVLFSVMESCGFVRNASGSFLDTIQDEAVAITFLELVSIDIGAWYKLMTSDPCAAPVLSQLFEEDTSLGDPVMTLVKHVTENPKKFKNDYEKALLLHRTICMSGPTTNSLTIYCTSAIAAIVHGLTQIVSSGRPSVVPNARLVMRMPQAHWLDLRRLVIGLMGEVNLNFTSGSGKIPSANFEELAHDVIVVGVLIWMATQKSDFLEKFCGPRKISLVMTDVEGATNRH